MSDPRDLRLINFARAENRRGARPSAIAAAHSKQGLKTLIRAADPSIDRNLIAAARRELARR